MTITNRIALLSCLGIALGCYQPSQADSSDVLKTTAVVAAIVAGAFLIGKACAHVSHNNATTRYTPTSDMIAQNVDNEQALRAELKKLIQLDNVTHHEHSLSPIRNYPLVQYKQDIDWYTNTLPVLNLFTFGHPAHQKIPVLVRKLHVIKHYVITDPTYIDERRKADERIQDLNHVQQHHVVVQH